MALRRRSWDRQYENAISRVKEDEIGRSGGVPLVASKVVSKSCVATYENLLANHSDVSLVNKATGKSKHRVTAERPKRRVACHIGLAGSTHFFPVSEEDLDIRAKLKRLDEDAWTLYDMASEACGTAVVPVKPQNIWSIDNTSFWKFGGLSNLNGMAKLTTKDSVKASGSESVWTLDEGNDFNGIRVLMTFAFSAAGTCLPLVVCVSGLS